MEGAESMGDGIWPIAVSTRHSKGDGCNPEDCNGRGEPNGRDGRRQDTSRQLPGWVRGKV